MYLQPFLQINKLQKLSEKFTTKVMTRVKTKQS